MSNRLKGKPKSKKHIENMTISLIKNGRERGVKISASLKNVTKTNAHKKNLSKAHKNKTLSEQHKINIGKSNKGIPNSEKQKKVASITMKKVWKEKGCVIGKKISATKRKLVEQGIGVGESCHTWRGGKSFEPYPTTFNNSLKRKIKKRDNYACQNPNCKKGNKSLHIHHIDYDKQNGCETNFITLCRPCHTQTNFRRKYWINFYSEIIRQKYLKAA